jgi:secondary thiamine-phosphate synthase enzyme
MKTYTEYLIIRSNKEKEMINITDKIKNALRVSKISEGLCLINSIHITSSIYINDNEDGLKEDFINWLEDLAPEKSGYKHNQTGETNADAHLKRK